MEQAKAKAAEEEKRKALEATQMGPKVKRIRTSEHHLHTDNNVPKKQNSPLLETPSARSKHGASSHQQPHPVVSDVVVLDDDTATTDIPIEAVDRSLQSIANQGDPNKLKDDLRSRLDKKRGVGTTTTSTTATSSASMPPAITAALAEARAKAAAMGLRPSKPLPETKNMGSLMDLDVQPLSAGTTTTSTTDEAWLAAQRDEVDRRRTTMQQKREERRKMEEEAKKRAEEEKKKEERRK